jgi:hypothetical protein
VCTSDPVIKAVLAWWQMSLSATLIMAGTFGYFSLHRFSFSDFAFFFIIGFAIGVVGFRAEIARRKERNGNK